MRIFCQFATFALARQPALVNELVVFHEPDKNTRKYPRHGDLIKIVISPDLERLSSAATFLNLAKCLSQPNVDLGVLYRTSQKIFCQVSNEFLEFWKERLDWDHFQSPTF
jgi:hypothetical protein